MAIAEAQLETWSGQGKTGQFTETYNRIREHLLDGGAPYPVKNTEIFLQGSYGNDTNVHGDSDVDIVLKHTGAYHYDITGLPAENQKQWEDSHSGGVAYGYTNFKSEAEGYIKRLYNDVVVGKKAVYVPGNANRRNADVLVCQQFRRYTEWGPEGGKYYEGISFMSGGKRIENFPKHHSDNCTAKHQATYQNFKRMVRIFKNMRNRMIDEGQLAEGIAPSYYIEGMLYNVPNDKFTGSYQDMWVSCFNHVVTAERAELLCANRLQPLVLDGSSMAWSVANFAAFTAAAKKYWES